MSGNHIGGFSSATFNMSQPVTEVIVSSEDEEQIRIKKITNVNKAKTAARAKKSEQAKKALMAMKASKLCSSGSSDDEKRKAVAEKAATQEAAAAHHDDYEIHGTDAGSSEISSKLVNEFRVGHYIMIDGGVCKITNITKSKTGKHGHAKASIVGTNVFTGKGAETHAPTSHSLEFPIVHRDEYTLIRIEDDGHLQLMDLAGNSREDVQLITEDDKKLIPFYQAANGREVIVTILSALGQFKVDDMKYAQ